MQPPKESDAVISKELMTNIKLAESQLKVTDNELEELMKKTSVKLSESEMVVEQNKYK